jgi:hypothetical protein
MEPSREISEGDLERACKSARKHRKQIESSDVCGCFHCLAIFPPAAIEEWIASDKRGVGQTAICPKCGEDSVIGSKMGFPITVEFLGEVKLHWFFR